jgi:hypothetical protein
MLLLPLPLRTTLFDPKGQFGQPEKKLSQVFRLENLTPTLPPPQWMSRHFAPCPKDCLGLMILHAIIASSLRTTLFDLSKGTLGSMKIKLPQVFSLENLKANPPPPLWKSRHLHQV